MSFYLYLMRHAKSDWSEQGKSDYDRPINARGQKNARQIGAWMVQNNFIPEKIISSSAIRAKQTTELLIEQVNDINLKDVQFDKDLYLATEETLIESIQLYKNAISSIMLVAHNPGIEHLINHLIKTPTGTINITTANLAIFEFTDNDFDPETDKGELVELIRPRELSNL